MPDAINLFSRQNLPTNIKRVGGAMIAVGAGCLVAIAITIHLFAIPYILAGGAVFFIFAGALSIKYGQHLKMLRLQEEQAKTLRSRLIRRARETNERVRNALGYANSGISAYVCNLIANVTEPFRSPISQIVYFCEVVKVNVELLSYALPTPIRSPISWIVSLGRDVKTNVVAKAVATEDNLQHIAEALSHINEDFAHIFDIQQPMDENEFLDPVSYQALETDFVYIAKQHYNVSSLKEWIANCKKFHNPIIVPHNRATMSQEMIHDLETGECKAKGIYKDPDPQFAVRLAEFKRQDRINSIYLPIISNLSKFCALSSRIINRINQVS